MVTLKENWEKSLRKYREVGPEKIPEDILTLGYQQILPPKLLEAVLDLDKDLDKVEQLKKYVHKQVKSRRAEHVAAGQVSEVAHGTEWSHECKHHHEDSIHREAGGPEARGDGVSDGIFSMVKGGREEKEMAEKVNWLVITAESPGTDSVSAESMTKSKRLSAWQKGRPREDGNISRMDLKEEEREVAHGKEGKDKEEKHHGIATAAEVPKEDG